MGMLDTTLIGPGLLFLNQYFDTFINELVVLWICFVSLSYFTIACVHSCSAVVVVSVLFSCCCSVFFCIYLLTYLGGLFTCICVIYLQQI